MKPPQELVIYPVDVTRYAGDSGVWVRLPEWVVRAYKLNPKRNQGMRIKCVVSREQHKTCQERHYEEQHGRDYWRANWCKKLEAEERKARQAERNRLNGVRTS